MNSLVRIYISRPVIFLILVLSVSDCLGQILFKIKDIKCAGDENGSIEVLVQNATDPISYIWEDGSTEKDRSGLGVGSYSLTVIDATGCQHERSAFVDGPTVSLNLSIHTQTDPGPHACWRPVPLTVSAIASGGTPPYIINNETTDIFTQRIGGTGYYTYYVRDANGCKVETRKKYLVGSKWCAQDPNEIVGPSGYEDPRWVSDEDTIHYTIRFENDPLIATAPAQQVFITHDFDVDVNPFTLRLGTFGFGDHTFAIPENVSSYQKRYDLREELDLYVDVIAGLDVHNLRAFWNILAIDPLTGQRPLDPLRGFLPVNDTLTGSGEGFVTFSLKTSSDVETGDTLHARAKIFFDENEAIVTNTWTNKVDAFPPTTVLNALESVTESNTIQLSWIGEDDPGGSGISHYEIYASRHAEPFEGIGLAEADSFQITFVGEYGATYQFYVLGVDNAGNRESKENFEASVYILPHWEVQLTSNLPDVVCISDTIAVNFTTILAAEVDLAIRIDSNTSLIPIASGIDTAMHTYLWPIPDSLQNHSIRIFLIATDSTSIRDSSGVMIMAPLPDVDAGENQTPCAGELIYLAASGANSYHWSPQIGLNFQSNSIQPLYADGDATYHVIGTDVYGCTNSDSVTITVHPTYLDSLTHLMCNEDSVFVGGDYQTEPGFYVDELISNYGCDSTVITEVVLTGPCPFPAPQVYVDKDATGLNNGTSWANAFLDLQDALAAVSYYENVREIWIAEGIYRPSSGDRDSSYVLTDSVLIFGGFLGIEDSLEERSADPSLVQISGDIGMLNDSTDNTYHIFRIDTSCVDCALDGVTIRFGQADLPFNQAFVGAGIYNSGVLQLNNCIIERNTSLLEGAAIYNTGTLADLLITNCIFRLNTSTLERDILNDQGAMLQFGGLIQVQK